MRKYAVIVNGGIGKNIAFTSVLRCLSKTLGQKVSVITGWPLVYHGNPYINRVWQFGSTDQFYDTYSEDGVWILETEPYKHPDYVAKERHLVDVWCEQLGTVYDGGLPELFPFIEELYQAEQFVANLQETKPVLIAQFWGGPVPQEGQPKPPRGQRRGIPHKAAQEIVDALKDQYHILEITATGHPKVEGTTPLFDQLRVVLAAIKYADKLLLIDSFAQHAAAAFNKPATVLWCGTSEKVLGYDIHNNIVTDKCPTPQCQRPYGWLFDTLAGGIEWSCPHGEVCVNHNVKAVIDEILEKK